jgi:hypothetical protein
MLALHRILILLILVIITISYNSNNKKYIICRKLRKHLSSSLIDDYQYTPPPSSLPSDYVFIPPEVGTEIYLGSIIAIIPIIWASFEFASRIRVQQECLVCKGSGLVYVTKQGNPLTRARKCWSCGGFLPWLGWKMFFLSTFTDVGNGGVLQRPSKDYNETNEKIKKGILVLDNNKDNNQNNEDNTDNNSDIL